jgi:Fe-S cluster assembly iron-binding protein IscA
MKKLLSLVFFLIIGSISHATSGFRENIGQIKNQNGQPSEAVRFLLHCPNFNVQLRSNGFSYDFLTFKNDQLYIDRVDFNFENSNPDFSIEKILPDTPFNSTFVSDLEKEQYAEIVYKNFYKGIDLIFRRKGDQGFEYDFHVRQNGNVNDIVFKIDGAQIVQVEAQAIYLSTENISFKETIPFSYDKQNRSVNVSFYKNQEDRFQFYSPQVSSQLTIDPTPELLYATFLNDDWSVADIKLLDNLDYLILGTTGAPTNIATEGSYQTALDGIFNSVLSRFNAAHELLWSTYFGNDVTTSRQLLVIDERIFFCGITESENLASEGAYQMNNGGLRDVYLAEFTLNGDFEHCTYLGGVQNDIPTSIESINVSQIALTGQTASIDFPTINSSNTYTGGNDGFVVIFDINSHDFVYSSLFGGEGEDIIQGLEIHADNQLVFFGISSSSTIQQSSQTTPPSSLFSISNHGGFDAWIGLLNEGFILEWSGFVGGSGLDEFQLGAMNSVGSLILVGSAIDTQTPYTPDAQFTNFDGITDGEVIYVLDENFNLTYCSNIYPLNTIGFGDIVVDENDFIYIGSNTNSDSFIATEGAYREEFFFNPSIQPSRLDACIFYLSPQGLKIWGTYFGNYTPETVQGIDVSGTQLMIAGGIGSDVNYPEEYQHSFVTADAFNSQITIPSGFIAIFDNPINIVETEETNKLMIFPNPSSDFLYLLGNPYELRSYAIYSSIGKCVMMKNTDASFIDIQFLPSGIYTLSLMTDEGVRSLSFVKE